jgi:plastocyanin
VVRRLTLRLIPAVALTAALVVAATNVSAGPVSASATPPEGIHVEVRDDYFLPAAVNIPRGGTIIFDHLGPSHHTATDGTGMGLYDSGSVDESSPPTWYTFEAAGLYPFVCVFHPQMSGRAYVPVRAAPATGRASKTRTITWATGLAPDGFVYDVQIRRPGSGWTSWRTATLEPSTSFLADAGTGRYRFRARLHESGVAASRWSQPAMIEVR